MQTAQSSTVFNTTNHMFALSGDRVASYKELGYKSPVTDVDFHPHEHMVAFCSYGENHPVLVYKYDHSGKGFSFNWMTPTYF